MSEFSEKKDPAWYFMQWASGVDHGAFGATRMDFVNPVRASVWANRDFRDRLGESYPGYVEQHDVSAPGREDLLHAAAALLRPHDGVGGEPSAHGGEPRGSVAEELDALAESVNRQLADAGLG